MPTTNSPPATKQPENSRQLAELSTEQFARLAKGKRPLVVLLPVGSVEPHGPHLPLCSDTSISLAAAQRACDRLRKDDTACLIAPSIGYGVTDFAEGFAGALSVPAKVLTAYVGAVAVALLGEGAAHVCIVNNHLEPDHDAALRAVLKDESLAHYPHGVSLACPLKRRWGRTLSAEYKSGACHAGRYETSLLLASRPELVDQQRASQLPAIETSLSAGIVAGKNTFSAMGLTKAYTGAPAEATVTEGNELLDLLANMICGETNEALEKAGLREPAKA
jgi:creatinine amidohydrolase